jgi:hypothetical protein
MAQRAEVRLSDDMSGAEIPPGNGETVVFSVDGTSCEIDLTAENVSVLRKALRPYIEAGGPLEGFSPLPAGPRRMPAHVTTAAGPDGAAYITPEPSPARSRYVSHQAVEHVASCADACQLAQGFRRLDAGYSGDTQIRG